MKNLKNLFVLGLGVLAFSSCNDSVEVEADPEAVLSKTEALDMVEESITFENAGLVLEIGSLDGDIDDVLSEVGTLPEGTDGFPPNLCGQTQTKSKSGSFSGPNVSWDYSWDWSRTLYCNDEGEPEYFDVDWDASRSFENMRATSSASADGDWIVTFDNTSSDFFIKIYNGDYMRNIDRQSKVNERGHSAELDVNIVDVQVRRADQFILGGKLYFTMTGENNSGNTFSRSGEVLFNGDCTATITIDGGGSRTVSICD